ncbi:hypothetical protein BRADI_2g04555v3 [Brachypodium distachyon]|uniref:Uncharacterized protein n=1 Tax=Brachypodium distachyon TaxID=15368 RepID=A0A2K2D6Z9_BRADI|nr:hypothetical protein BRADI_2g04555v3 [Brachypodium distachyon]
MLNTKSENNRARKKCNNFMYRFNFFADEKYNCFNCPNLIQKIRPTKETKKPNRRYTKACSSPDHEAQERSKQQRGTQSIDLQAI